VLLVGTGNCGADIAMDVIGAGHEAWLAGRDAGELANPIA
jgi:hypothetical protein